MNKFWQNAIESPKTTALGICIFAGMTASTLMSFVHGDTARQVLLAIIALSGTYSAYLGASMKDAGKQLAIPANSETPQMVESHEVPDKPGSTIVKNG
jgi:hypothetical protein